MNSALSPLLTFAPLRRLLGIPPDVARQMEQTSLYFAGGWTVRMAAVTLGVAALWFGFLYLRDGTRPSLWVKVPLLLLRLLAVAALVVMLFQPMLRLVHTDRIKPTVVVMVDTSDSMNLKDPRLPAERATPFAEATGGSPTQLSRADLAARLLNGPQGNLLAVLSREFNVRAYTFDSAARPVNFPTDPAQQSAFRIPLATDPKTGTSTQMGTALKRALDDVTGQPIGGALVLSDGGSNLGDDPSGVAERAKEQGLAVSTLGIGDPTPTRDIAVTEVLADSVVRKENTVQVFAGIAHRGFEGQKIAVVLKRGNEVVGTQNITLGAAAKKQTVTFTYPAKTEGNFTYTVSTAVLPNETTAENNRKTFQQRVITKKLKILYVEGEPRWEYRYLKNAILRDKQILFSCFLTSAGAMKGGEGNVPIFQFPQDEKTLFEYDILILGDVPVSTFSRTQLQQIRRFVEDKGSSLVVIAGDKRMPYEYRGTPLEDVLPVVLGAAPERVVTTEPFRWELTPEGRQDPLLRLAADSAENMRIWANLSGMYYHAGVARAKPGATVLAVNPLRSNEYGKRVILAVQRFGAGRCLAQLSDSTWLWRYRVGDRYFYRYWGQALRVMTPQEPVGGNRFAQINADRPDYRLGERASFHARLLDNYYRPVKDAKVTATLVGESGREVPVTLDAVPGSPGLYTGEYAPDRIDKYKISLASPANPQAKATAEFKVESEALERQQPEMNEALMKKVAKMGGGAYLAPNELKKWRDSLRREGQIVRSESEHELWDAPLLLALFIVPLALEWVVRKRSGLL